MFLFFLYAPTFMKQFSAVVSIYKGVIRSTVYQRAYLRRSIPMRCGGAIRDPRHSMMWCGVMLCGQMTDVKGYVIWTMHKRQPSRCPSLLVWESLHSAKILTAHRDNKTDKHFYSLKRLISLPYMDSVRWYIFSLTAEML